MLPAGWEERKTATGITFWFSASDRRRTFRRPTEPSAEDSRSCRRCAATATLADLCRRAVIDAADDGRLRTVAAPSEVADSVLQTLFQQQQQQTAEAAKRVLCRVGSALREFALPSVAGAAVGRLAKELVSGVAEHCRALQTLSLRGCSAVTPLALARISRANAQTLEHVDVSLCSGLDSAAIQDAVRVCANLRSLAVDHCVGAKQPLTIDAPRLQSLRATGLVVPALSLRCPVLLWLDCSDCWDVVQIAWDGFGAASLLAELNLFRCKKLAGPSFAEFVNARRTPDLRYLNICECALIEEKDAVRAFSGLSALTHIVATQSPFIGEDAISALARGCPRLVSLFLNDCPRVTDTAMAHLALCSALEGCSFAESIRDATLSLIAHSNASTLAVADLTGSAIGDAGVSALLRECTQLRTLSISECSELTDACFAPLADAAHPSSGLCLRNLAAQFVALTDEALRIIAGRCRSLASIDLLHNSLVTDDGAVELVRGCPLLATVNFSFCTHLTGATLAALASVQPEDVALSLDIYACQLVPLEAVLALLSRRRVREINVSSTLRDQLASTDASALHGAQIHTSRGDPIFP